MVDGVASWSSGDESLVYSPASGDTHLLDIAATEGLACFDGGPLQIDQLCSQIASRTDVANDHVLEDYVLRLLGKFVKLGLVERTAT
jgi:PqqD family protein of HPr-rel-A system